MILVTGAGGKTGQAIIQTLRQRNAAVRGLVRRQSQRPALEEWGAEVIVGDMLVAADVRRAAEGARAIYHIAPNMTRHEQLLGRIALEAAAAEGARFIYHSVLHPQIEAMPHHWHKMHVEETIFEMGVPFTILQPTAYMQNLLAYWESILQGGILSVPYPPQTALSLVDLADVAAAAAIVLTEPGHEGAIYELVGTAPLTQIEVGALFSQQLSRTVQVVEQPLAEWEAQSRASGMGDYSRETLMQMFRYYAYHGLVGNNRVLRWLLGRPPTDLGSFIQRQRETKKSV